LCRYACAPRDLLAHFGSLRQPIGRIQAANAFGVHGPAFTSEHYRQPPITETDSAHGQLAQAHLKRGLRISAAPWFMAARLTVISPATRHVLTAKTAWVHCPSSRRWRGFTALFTRSPGACRSNDRSATSRLSFEFPRAVGAAHATRLTLALRTSSARRRTWPRSPYVRGRFLSRWRRSPPVAVRAESAPPCALLRHLGVLLRSRPEDHAGRSKLNLSVARFAGFGSTDDSVGCLLYTSPSPRDLSTSRMPSSA